MFDYRFFSKSVFGLLLFFILILTSSSTAQTKDARGKDVLQKILAKRQNSPFVLITPEETSKLSADERNALLAPQAGCDTAVIINFGQTVNDSLTTSDCRLDDGSYGDFYAFEGTAGQQVTVSLGSSAFDTYLILGNETGSFFIEDDDDGGGTNSRITATLPATGFYIILANSYDAGQFGDYTLSLSGGSTPPNCTYTLTPSSANVPAAGGSFSFTINTQTGCQWSAISNSAFIFSSLSGSGTATISYSVDANNSLTSRTGTIAVAGQTFTVTQNAFVCTYSLSPTGVNAPAQQIFGGISVATQPGCELTAVSNVSWITVNSVTVNTNGAGTVTYTIGVNSNTTPRTGTISIRGQTFTVNQAAGAVAAARKSFFDFDGDRKSDVSLFRPSDRRWYILYSSGSSNSNYSSGDSDPHIQYGLSTDKIVTADYDGDGKTDFAVYRPETGF